MSQKSNYYPVNWLDGMKINKNHFVDQENAFTQQVSDTIKARITEYNYGMLPSTSGDGVIIKIDLENNNTVYIKITHCRALTFGGYLIDIADKESNPLSLSASYPQSSSSLSELNGTLFYIILSVNPYKRIPVGDVNPEEEPLRYPYTSPEYKLHVVPLSELGKEPLSSHLIIGKLKANNGQALLANDYIPSSTTLYSHPALIELHGILNNMLARLELHSLSIIQKIIQKEQEHKLAQIVKSIAENILIYLNIHLYRFRRILKNEAPIELVNSISILAKTIKNTIDMRQGTGKEELLNYFVEWCEVNQGQFENLVSEVINIEYSHIEIHDSMDKCLRFVKEIDFLFQKLNELDYIGRKSDHGMIVKEEMKTENQRKTKNFFGI